MSALYEHEVFVPKKAVDKPSYTQEVKEDKEIMDYNDRLIAYVVEKLKDKLGVRPKEILEFELDQNKPEINGKDLPEEIKTHLSFKKKLERFVKSISGELPKNINWYQETILGIIESRDAEKILLKEANLGRAKRFIEAVSDMNIHIEFDEAKDKYVEI